MEELRTLSPDDQRVKLNQMLNEETALREAADKGAKDKTRGPDDHNRQRAEWAQHEQNVDGINKALEKLTQTTANASKEVEKLKDEFDDSAAKDGKPEEKIAGLQRSGWKLSKTRRSGSHRRRKSIRLLIFGRWRTPCPRIRRSKRCALPTRGKRPPSRLRSAGRNPKSPGGER